jgi:hypothetical protein
VSRAGPHAGFLGDLRAAIGVWGRSPGLPIWSVVVLAGPVIILGAITRAECPGLTPGCGMLWTLAATTVLLPVLLFSIGWPGTERAWYLWGFQGNRMTPGTAWTLTWGYFGRFLRLGLVLMPLFIAPFVLMTIDRRWEVGLVVVTVLLDFGLTFVTPALAYSTGSALEALGIGLRVIRRTWPSSAPYVLVPPLAFQLLARLEPPTAFVADLGLQIAWVLTALLLKGAIARFYLRRFHPEDLQAVPPG